MMKRMDGLRKTTELSPLAAAVAEDIRKHQMIRGGDSIIVGLSGGPDSVCLLSILAELRQELAIRSLHAVHVNHGLRGEESDQDQVWAEVVAHRLGATFDAARFDIRKIAGEQKIGEEEAGRQLRYATFETYRQRYGAQRIAVAHNRNDQAETVMMRLIRGTGLRGLSGIDWIRDDGIVIRPLLGVRREEIENYCFSRDLEFRTDSTNLKPVFTRNWIRLNLIPFIEREYNPRLQDALVRLAEQAEETEDYLRQTAACYLDGSRDGCEDARWNERESSLNPEGFEKLHKAVAGRVLLEILERTGAAVNVTSDTISRMIQLVKSEKEPMETDLHNGYYARKTYGRVWILKRKTDDDEIIREPVLIPLEILETLGTAEIQAGHTRILLSLSERGKWNREKRSQKKPGKIRAALDLDRLLTEGVPAFRNRKPGDRFRPIGMSGRKKIQDYFTDRKIPRQTRDSVILLALGHDVFLAGGEVSGDCAVTKDTRRVLIIEYNQGNAD